MFAGFVSPGKEKLDHSWRKRQKGFLKVWGEPTLSLWGWESPSLRKWFNPFMTCMSSQTPHMLLRQAAFMSIKVPANKSHMGIFWNVWFPNLQQTWVRLAQRASGYLRGSGETVEVGGFAARARLKKPQRGLCRSAVNPDQTPLRLIQCCIVQGHLVWANLQAQSAGYQTGTRWLSAIRCVRRGGCAARVWGTVSAEIFSWKRVFVLFTCQTRQEVEQ